MYTSLLAAFWLSAVCITAAPAPPPKPSKTAKIFAENFPSIAVRVGNSNDVFKVLLDTASQLFWINPGSLKHPSSTTHKSSGKFHIKYMLGSAAGSIRTDAIHIGELNQLDLEPSRQFGLANTELTEPMINEDGILGMSLFDPEMQPYAAGWDMLAPVLNPRVVGLRMQHPLPGVTVGSEDAVGQIDYGGVDPVYAKQGITYVPVVPEKIQAAWVINTHGLHVNGKPSGMGARQALLDTGSTGIVMTAADAATVHGLLGGKVVKAAQRHQPDKYLLPCNMFGKTLEVDIGGTLFPVPNYLLINGRAPNEPGMCKSWIQGSSTGSWTLGSGFLQAVYSVWDFDNKRVGFAKVPPLDETSTSLGKGSPGASAQGKGEPMKPVH